MKNKIFSALLFIGALSPARAQKIVDKHIPFGPRDFVAMNFQISDSIRIMTWKKDEVYIHSSIDVNDNKNNDDYKMVFGESGQMVNVSAKLETDDIRRSSKDSGDCCCCCNVRTHIYHVVYVPENVDFSVETINGNITIAGNTAEIRAKSISGFIDLAISPDRKADLKMHTITGTMYSNIELPPSRRIKQVGGGSVTAELNNGGKPITLETISGDIFFRKES
jgi:hypothetical protein